DLAAETYRLIANPMTRFTLFQSMISYHYDELHNNKQEAWLFHGNSKLSKDALDNRFRSALENFINYFREWLKEMAASEVAFSALDAEVKDSNIYNCVVGKPVKKDLISRMREGTHLNHYRTI